MSDLILHIASRTRVARYSLANNLASNMRKAAHNARERFTREQTGQDMVEYAGVLLVVAIIVAAVVASPIAGLVSDAVTNLVSDITGGHCPQGQTCK